MARIVMADDGIPFNGMTPERGPLGGAESAFVALAEALAARGHDVAAFTSASERLSHRGVEWAPLAEGTPESADLYIANRGDKLLLRVPAARHTAFWIHNPAMYLKKWRYIWKLFRRQPTMVFLGDYHASTCPAWLRTGQRVIIPLGVDDRFRTIVPPQEPPPPRAVFTSNPLRSLDWLIELWVTRVHPAAKTAELHIFSGASTYGAAGTPYAEKMAPVLLQAERMSSCGIVLRQPVSKAKLAEELAEFRVFTYRGTYDETFCVAAAEAQAVGLPAVVCDVGALPERVEDRVSGFVVTDEDGRDERDFAAATLKLLTDDNLWRRLHAGALAHKRNRSWDDVAAEFEDLLPEPA